MLIALIVVAAVLLGLVIALGAVHLIRPESFKLSATITRWCSLTLEIKSPPRGAGLDVPSSALDRPVHGPGEGHGRLVVTPDDDVASTDGETDPGRASQSATAQRWAVPGSTGP